VLSNRYNVPVVSQWSQCLNAVNYLMMREPGPTRKGGPKAALSLARSTILRRAVAADQGPPVQPNKASSTDERIPDLRAIVAATTLQSGIATCLTSAAASFSMGLTATIGNERFRFGGNREPQLMWSLLIRHLGNPCPNLCFI
jgi:hypothetical protein